MDEKRKQITVAEAARDIGVSPRRVLTLIYEGRLKGHQINQRLWLVDRESVDAFVKLDRPKGRPKKEAAAARQKKGGGK